MPSNATFRRCATPRATRAAPSGIARRAFILAAALSTACATPPRTAEPPSAARTVIPRVVVDGASSGRRFDGLGAVSAGGSSRLLFDYPEAERAQILDYMFKPGYGAAVHILKVEIGGEVNGTVGSEASHMRGRGEVNCDRGYEWWLMHEARKRNPAIKLAGLQWGAPGWLEGGFWSKDNVDYIIKWLDCATQRGLRIDYVGGWNESGYDPAWFPGYKRALQAAYPHVQLIAADNAHTAQWNVVPVMVRDTAFGNAVDIIGVHGPGGSRTDPDYMHVESSDVARSTGKPQWASELSSLAHDVGAMPLARVFNRSYIDARITGQMIWTPVSAWYPTLPIADTGPIVAEWPWSGFYAVGSSVWSLAHTTQFTAPGWRYLDTGSERLASGATIVSLLAPDSRDVTIVVEAMDVASPTTLALELRNVPPGALHLWATDLRSKDREQHFRRIGLLTPVGGVIELPIEPRHLYTISTRTGAGRGGAEPRTTVEAQMPLPFREDFESLAPGRLARFFSDVNGSFETVRCGGGRSGICYRQMVARQPVEWHGPDMPPTTIAGDARWWGDYRVSADVMLEGAGHVELLGRIDGVGGDETVSGYHLQLDQRGAWRLYAQDVPGVEVTLASGRSTFSAGRWHAIALEFRGRQATVFIDGAQVAQVRDDRHRIGQVGLRSSRWVGAQFDNVAVTALDGGPVFIPQSQMTATATTAHDRNAFGYHYPASAAIDGRPETFWRSEWEPPATPPHAITVDLGSVREVGALTYQPRISGHWAARSPGNPISPYSISLSTDGSSFERVASGTWRHSVAATKVASFGGVRRARYVRLEAGGSPFACDQSVTAGEINVATRPIVDPSPDVELFPGEMSTLVPRTEMSAVASAPGAGSAANAVDGNCDTHWEPEAAAPLPQALTLDLGRNRPISGLAYVPRQSTPLRGAITRYNVYVSNDGQEFTRVASGGWPGDFDTKFATWASRSARYLRLEAMSTSGGNAGVAELHVGHAR